MSVRDDMCDIMVVSDDSDGRKRGLFTRPSVDLFSLFFNGRVDEGESSSSGGIE